MKNIFLSVTSIVMLAILVSCGNNKSEEQSTETISKDPTCFYAFDSNSNTSIKWTAFKTSAKIGVNGQFDQVAVTAGEKSTKITDLLKTIKFSTKTESTNTGNEDRDNKIINSFFGTMITTDIIYGQIKSVEGDNTAGTCTAFLTLNNVEREIELNYTLDDNVISLTGEIDINNWNGQAALTALNEVCSDLHKGEDGESITWPNVALNIQSVLKKDCH